MNEIAKSSMRRFVFVRDEDVSGVSGIGVVAEGVELSDGSVALKWLTFTSSVAFYANIKQMVAIHGHEGCGRIEWLDPDPNEDVAEEQPKKTTKSRGKK